MVTMHYHKGQQCVYSSVFCQEGYCSECEICQHWSFQNFGDLSRKSIESYSNNKETQERKLVFHHN
jgi:hypothetical protein